MPLTWYPQEKAQFMSKDRVHIVKGKFSLVFDAGKCVKASQ